MRRALTLALIATAVAAPAASAQAPDYTIRAKGSKTGLGKVSAIGPFKLVGDPNLGGATAVFGTPSSLKKTDKLCPAGWRAIGLRIHFVNLGGGDSCQFGSVQTVSAFGKVWRTERGLKIGSSTKTLRKLYPNALRKGRTYRLVGAKSIFTDGSRYSVLAARTNGKQVKSFRLFVGAAGE
jgi:hypothetical protein